MPVDVPVVFEPRILEPGTIRKAIGEGRWENFERMKEKKFPACSLIVTKRDLYLKTLRM